MQSSQNFSRFNVWPISGAATCVLALAACSSLPSPGSRSVQIQRTTHGLAHITAPDYEGVGYGTAYAHAQDNVCQTADYLLTARGDRSQYLGADSTSQFGLGLLTNTQIDLFVRAHMDDDALARAASAISADAKAALRGYVAGYNRYLQDTSSANLPEPCRNQPWVRPMTSGDLARTTELSMIQGGLGALAGAVLAAAPPTAKTSVAPIDLQQAALTVARYSFNANPDGGELGSNGWAFGKNATPNGAGVLLGNPHFPWTGINRFWQMHLTIPGKLDIMGATGGLSPVVSIGFNKDVAWTHTVSTGKRFTLYELKLDPSDPTVYVLDGQRKKMNVKKVTLPAMPGGSASGTTQVSRNFYSTDWGPVVSLPAAGLGWTTDTAYALADANTLNVRSADSWMHMALARDVGELRTAMGNQGIPWINTIAADRNGSAMYADLSVVPDVSVELLKTCAPSPRAAALFNAAGLAILDGARAACAWAKDPAAAAPGIITAARMPVIITPDWVQNSNDSYWLSNPAITPMPGVSPLVGNIGTIQRLRTRIGILEIQARLAGTDGLPGDKMGVDEVRSVLFRDKNLAALLVMDDLIAACSAAAPSLTADATVGCKTLGVWDRTSNSSANGATLFREFWRKAKDIPKVWRVPFDATKPITTPAGLDIDNVAIRTAVFKALGEAVALVRTAGFAVDAPLAMTQTRQVAGQTVTIHGGDEFEGVLNKVESQGQPALNANGYNINYGSSYIQAVTFDERGPIAQGLLTYGQSSNPASPYAYDQLKMFSTKRWLTLPFHAADIKAQQLGQSLELRY